MVYNVMSNSIPTPFDLLVNFEDSGNATFVSYLFQAKSEWLSKNLSPEQRLRCEAIRKRLEVWQEQERQEGPGAALNLSHEKMMAVFNERRWVRMKFANQIANAERVASLQPGAPANAT
ncbi:hypothetical protein [Rhizobium sp. LCM 4573]|uniref:hypothetical protein n=1 Tax=Rhizobium sp. LCM 4573 TaxID=1848291 RepID=UPI0010424ACC|nr:hypothetical protein [Rhizobium sp. LCM 4573]